MADQLPRDDHDILILLAERVRALTEKIDSYTAELSTRLGGLETRVGELEKKAERQAGFLGGVSWVKQLIVAAPAGVIAFLLGKGEIPS